MITINLEESKDYPSKDLFLMRAYEHLSLFVVVLTSSVRFDPLKGFNGLV